MASIAEHRIVSVREAILLHPENGVLVGIGLWKNLAKVLLPLIGKYDFEFLFSRSLHLNRMRVDGTVSWETLAVTRSAYEDLQDRFRDHGIEERNIAAIGLLNTFIDNLILLIGDGLTEQVLNWAWHEQRHPESSAVQQAAT
jgi:hypothetical protein